LVDGLVVDFGLRAGLDLPAFLFLLALAPEAPELLLCELLPVEPSVLTSLMSALTDRIVGESGPSSSITPALANAALVNPAAASGFAALHQLLVPTALCLATIPPFVGSEI
jgi:hypothetical protein